MSKFASVLTISLFLVTLTACGGGGGKYADVKAAMGEFADINTDFFKSIEKAENAKDVAAAINQYSADMESIAPKMKELMEKYPELKDQKEPPPELKGSVEAMENDMKKLMNPESNVAKKMFQYMMDPEVQAAQKKLMEVMSKLK